MQLPSLFGLNGFSVEAEHYQTVSALLASRGYVVVLSDYRRPAPQLPPGSPLPRPGCPNTYVFTSSGLLNTFARYASSSQQQQLQVLPSKGFVLLGHSMGGFTAIAMLSGQCTPSPKPSLASLRYTAACQSYQPNVGAVTCPAAAGGRAPINASKAKAVAAPAAKCATATATEAEFVTNTSSSSSSSASQAAPAATPPASPPVSVLGVINWEGYLTTGNMSDRSGGAGALRGAGFELPPGTFMAYLAGQANSRLAKEAFDGMKLGGRCACAEWVRFNGLNHFGINDWQPGGRQVTPCAMASPGDPPGFSVTESRQEAALQGIALVIDATMRANVLQDPAAQELLRRLAAGSNSSSSDRAGGATKGLQAPAWAADAPRLLSGVDAQLASGCFAA